MFKDIYSQLHFIPQALIVFVLAIFSSQFIRENRGEIKNKTISFIKTKKWFVAFLFYSALLITGTVLGRPRTYPYDDLIGYMGFIKKGKINYGAIENILLFIPLTFLYIKAFNPEKKFEKSQCFSIVTTLFIELFQLLFWLGQFSLADIIQNTIGGLMGYVIWYIVECLNKNRAC